LELSREWLNDWQEQSANRTEQAQCQPANGVAKRNTASTRKTDYANRKQTSNDCDFNCLYSLLTHRQNSIPSKG